MLTRVVSIMSAALVLIACGAGGPTRVESEQAYVRHAGPDLERVRFTGFVQGWQPIGTDSVLMSFSRNVYYLLELSPVCHMELRQANHIALKTTTRQTISKFDRVQIGNSSCRITAIREVDFEAARADIQDQRELGEDFERTVDLETESD